MPLQRAKPHAARPSPVVHAVAVPPRQSCTARWSVDPRRTPCGAVVPPRGASPRGGVGGREGHISGLYVAYSTHIFRPEASIGYGYLRYASCHALAPCVCVCVCVWMDDDNNKL